MRTTTLLVFILTTLLFQEGKSQVWQWANRIGLDGGGNDGGLAIVRDKAGNIYSSGRVKSNTTFGWGSPSPVTPTAYGDRDAYLCKYDSAGNFIWARRYGGPYSDYSYNITSDDSSNIYMTGYYTTTCYFETDTLTAVGGSDIYVAKISPQGNLLWAKSLGGPGSEWANAISVSPTTGEIYIAGLFSSSIICGTDTLTCSGTSDCLVAKFDPNGNCLWGRRAGGTSQDEVKAMQMNDAGTGVFITGYYIGNCSFGSHALGGLGGSDVFVAKYDAGGTCTWAVRAASNNTEFPVALSKDMTGHLYVTGTYTNAMAFGAISIPASTGGQDFFLAKYDTLGNAQWAENAGGGTGTDNSGGMTINKFNDPVVTGVFETTCNFAGKSETAAGSRDVFVAEYDSLGAIIWIKTYKGITSGGIYAGGHGVVTDNRENVYFTGEFLGNTYFDTISLTAAGVSGDVVTGQLSPYVKAKFSESAGSICEGQTVVFGDLSRGRAVSWDWSFPGATVTSSTLQNPAATYTTAGTYDVQLIISNDIQSDTLLMPGLITVNVCTGINEATDAVAVTIAPNPFDQYAELSISGSHATDVTFKLFNSLGQCVRETYVGAADHLTINKGELDAGLYFYSVCTRNAIMKSGKLLVN